MELQFFAAQTACVGIHALEVVGLRVLAFVKGQGAFPTTLVGMLIHPVAYEHAGVTALDPMPQVCQFKA